MNVKELTKELKKFPDDVNVEIVSNGTDFKDIDVVEHYLPDGHYIRKEVVVIISVV